MLAARKQWLAGHLQTRGTLVMDDGAVAALSQGNKVCCLWVSKRCRAVSVAVRWWFAWRRMGEKSRVGSPITVRRKRKKIIGQSSDAIVGLLGYMAEPELVHRDNLILV